MVETREDAGGLHDVVFGVGGIVARPGSFAPTDGVQLEKFPGIVFIGIVQVVLVVVDIPEHTVVQYHFGNQFFEIAQATPAQQHQVVEKSHAGAGVGGDGQELVKKERNAVGGAGIVQGLVDPPGFDEGAERVFVAGQRRGGRLRGINPGDGCGAGTVGIHGLVELQRIQLQERSQGFGGSLSGHLVHLCAGVAKTGAAQQMRSAALSQGALKRIQRSHVVSNVYEKIGLLRSKKWWAFRRRDGMSLTCVNENCVEYRRIKPKWIKYPALTAHLHFYSAAAC